MRYLNGRAPRWAALGLMVTVFSACAPAAPPSPGSGPSGANPGAQTVGRAGAAPGMGAGGGTPSVSITGGGLSGAEFSHPGAAGTGHAH
jgi:hypothetical protein